MNPGFMNKALLLAIFVSVGMTQASDEQSETNSKDKLTREQMLEFCKKMRVVTATALNEMRTVSREYFPDSDATMAEQTEAFGKSFLYECPSESEYRQNLLNMYEALQAEKAALLSAIEQSNINRVKSLLAKDHINPLTCRDSAGYDATVAAMNKFREESLKNPLDKEKVKRAEQVFEALKEFEKRFYPEN